LERVGGRKLEREGAGAQNKMERGGEEKQYFRKFVNVVYCFGKSIKEKKRGEKKRKGETKTLGALSCGNGQKKKS